MEYGHFCSYLYDSDAIPQRNLAFKSRGEASWFVHIAFFFLLFG